MGSEQLTTVFLQMHFCPQRPPISTNEQFVAEKGGMCQVHQQNHAHVPLWSWSFLQWTFSLEHSQHPLILPESENIQFSVQKNKPTSLSGCLADKKRKPCTHNIGLLFLQVNSECTSKYLLKPTTNWTTVELNSLSNRTLDPALLGEQVGSVSRGWQEMGLRT